MSLTTINTVGVSSGGRMFAWRHTGDDLLLSCRFGMVILPSSAGAAPAITNAKASGIPFGTLSVRDARATSGNHSTATRACSRPGRGKHRAMASSSSPPRPNPEWRVIELVDGERKPYQAGTAEWRGSEKRAKALADSMSIGDRFFVAEQVMPLAAS